MSRALSSTSTRVCLVNLTYGAHAAETHRRALRTTTVAPAPAPSGMPPAPLALQGGNGLRPPMGYCSWDDCASEVTEQRIKNVTRALISSGLAAKGYTYVNVDEGWLAARDASGAASAR